MKIIETVSEDGFSERWAIQDDDDPENAREIGIYIGVDISDLDWEGMHKRVHNMLHAQGVFTPEDIRAKGNAVTAIANVALVREIVRNYGA